MSEDPTKIPYGGFCYSVHPLRDGEVLSNDIYAFGHSLREYSYHKGFKSVLCPYWQRTDYGTVKCLFMKREYRDEMEPNSRELLVAAVGEEAAKDFLTSWALEDEIKICDINLEQDDD